MAAHPTRTLSALSQQFTKFSLDTKQSSALYSELSQQIASDEELLKLAGFSQVGQPAPNLLFGAVQYLLLDDSNRPVADYYRSLTKNILPPANAFPHFKSFCLKNEENIKELLQTRRVQTNEVGRCSYLFLVFDYIARQIGGKEMALIEVGASAGLNLNWDRYRYTYENNSPVGDKSSILQIRAALRGTTLPNIPDQFPLVKTRVGLEVNAIDLNDYRNTRWLTALIWPEQEERRNMLQAAIEIWRQHPQPIVEGNAVETLPNILAELPEHMPVVVFHSHVIYQFPVDLANEFQERLNWEGERRVLFHLSAEWIRTPTPELWLTTFSKGKVEKQHLALVDQHGKWIEWLQRGG